MMDPCSFLLVGNAPYTNRGCEAIVRGTTRILDDAFGRTTRYLAASFGEAAVLAAQAAQEPAERIEHRHLEFVPRLSLGYAKYRFSRLTGAKLDFDVHRLPFVSADFRAALEIGGDNYSFDYGQPNGFMMLDDSLRRRRLPLVLWGASVGPFSSDPAFERRMIAHLRQFALIAVRESRSLGYLRSCGLENVELVADPAFVMEPMPFEGLVLPPEFLGVNFSPLQARSAVGGDLGRWTAYCAECIDRLLASCELPIVLIPHVASRDPANDDWSLLERVVRRVAAPDRVTAIATQYSAAAAKWVIGRATAFVGARTHATIAALSQGVPTLSLAYSTKAWGINEDLFGHHDFCLDFRRLVPVDRIAESVGGLLRERQAVRRRLEEQLPAIKDRAFQAGRLLRARLEGFRR